MKNAFDLNWNSRITAACCVRPVVGAVHIPSGPSDSYRFNEKAGERGRTKQLLPRQS